MTVLDLGARFGPDSNVLEIGCGTEYHYVDDVISSDCRRWQKFILGKLNGFVLWYLSFFSAWLEYIIHRVTISKLIMLAREKILT
jgi:hypothetical protein